MQLPSSFSLQSPTTLVSMILTSPPKMTPKIIQHASREDHRGELPPSRLCAESLLDSTLDATGMGFAGNTDSSSNVFAAPEGMNPYHAQLQLPQTSSQHWDWASSPANGEIIAPAPMYAVPVAPQVAPHTPSTFSGYYGPNVTGAAPAGGGGAFKRLANNLDLDQETSHVRSPAAQLPTPAAMATLLNPPGRSEGELLPHLTSQQSGYGITRGVPGHASVSVLGVVNHSSHSHSLSSHPSSSVSASGAPRRLAEPRNGIINSATQEGHGAISETPASREKRHACTMCHKRFDRPSTLRKASHFSRLWHLLVHTGEKAHVCDTCGRRFGVQSNLNRHVKRCILKPVNTPNSSSPLPPPPPHSSQSQALLYQSASASPSTSTVIAQQSSPELLASTAASINSVSASPTISIKSSTNNNYDSSPSMNTGKRARNASVGASNAEPSSPSSRFAGSPPSDSHSASSPSPRANVANITTTAAITSQSTSSATSGSSTSGTTAAASSSSSRPPGQKRRRRAASPSNWVPPTLQNYNLLSADSYRVTSVPLPPVRRNMPKEERDSWDENVGVAPYHPCGWTGVLPGPGLSAGFGGGLGGRDVGNFREGGKGGWVLGRIPVF
ncbi:hypothetical protein D9613_001423 [Agrocybe pediades]|uniref:C2H2-type domain-containing protein n=1 Tax=Agrocybe pediades TaxID=84607 RepID=A0A8H4VUJ1_9AGAR|nr:hypothetical protein D9613_001423 [Agrocybe pediades]